MRCDETRELAPELALGIVDGEERAEALRHLSACADCRRAVEEMTEVADELLMVAPVQEPSAGFESRVVAAMGLGDEPSRRKRARWLSPRWLALRVGPVVATAAVTAAALVGVYHNDHVTADRYRAALDEAHGRSFQAERLTDEAGGRSRGGVRLRGLAVLAARDGRPRPSRLRQACGAHHEATGARSRSARSASTRGAAGAAPSR